MLQENKKYCRIQKIVKKACKALNIPSIKVKFNYKSDLSYELGINNRKNLISRINIDLLSLYYFSKIKNKTFIFNKYYKLNSIQKRIKFVLFHEVGHYYTCLNFPLTYVKYSKEIEKKLNTISELEYRNTKLEKLADKIAFYLLNTIK